MVEEMMRLSTAREVADWFTYVETYAPRLPIEDGISFERALDSLIDGVVARMRVSRSDVSKHWFQLALQELELAKVAFTERADDSGLKHLSSARAHYDSAVSRKAMKATFIVDAAGRIQGPCSRLP